MLLPILNMDIIIIIIIIIILNQQFITQSVVAECGSYFVITYNRCSLHEDREIKKRKRKIDK